MAFVTCPNCGNQVSTLAAACPRCGLPRTRTPPQPHPSLCPDCGCQVPGLVPACPNCGRPVVQAGGQGNVPHDPLRMLAWEPGPGLKLFGFCFALALVLGVMYACSSVLKDSPEDVSRQAEAQSRDEQIIRDRAALPEINVTADQLARAFDADWDSALRKYYDRRLRVTGPVRQVLNDSAISLGTVTSVKRVHASFKSTSGVSSLVRGQVVTVQCIGDDYVLGIVALRECSLAR